ncbi:MAG TPA: adenylyl-sulfate kinase [Acidimicrobiales bacterium]|nr:adenylyl-sulfate kinase [Acidimicrobiales bacterium]
MSANAVGSGEGVCIWLTGRSGAGKTTLVRSLTPLLDASNRTYTLLDTVPALAKQRWERTSENKLMRKAYVAAEVVRHGGIAICVTVSASRQVRAAARTLVGDGHFLEVYVDTPPEVAWARKSSRGRKPPLEKRLRARLRRVSRNATPGSFYEVPTAPDVTVDATTSTPDEAAQHVFDALVARRFIAPTQNPAALPL